MPAYLDYAATAPMLPYAIDAMGDAARQWSNPSSVHAAGRSARAALENARAQIADALGWDGAVVFTSGATEALGIALRQPGPRFVSAVEHSAVLGAAPDATRLAVDAAGIVDLGRLEHALSGHEHPLVAIMHVNNETGVIQPIDAIARIVRAAGGRLVVDAAQSAGKRDLPSADMIALSAHKLGGPPGIGALLVRDPAMIAPFAAGGQERGLRPGTENLPGIIGFAHAVEARRDRGWLVGAAALRAGLEARVRRSGGVVFGDGAPRVETITCLAMPGVAAMTQLIAFDLAGFAVSAGAACSSGRVKASHVLIAMGLSERAADEAIRVSLGWDTSAAEIDAFGDAWEGLAARTFARRAA